MVTFTTLSRSRWLRGMLAAAMLSGCGAPRTGAQQLDLDSLLRADRLRLDFTTDRSSGPGFDFLVEAAAGAQFVMVGESHNVKEIPQFTAQLFRVLHDRFGFDYLALEDGPFIAELYSDVRGDREASFALANRYVNALQFWNDQDIQLILNAGRISEAPGPPVWGLDQAWGALHILDRLRDLAPDPAARATAARLVDRVRALEARRPGEGRTRYISDTTTAADIDELERTFADGGPEAQRLIEMLEISNHIYRIRALRPNIYVSNNTRERYMRRNFMERYNQARASGTSLPRVLLKFGQWHAIKGKNWGDVMALGTMISELAGSNGMESLHIWTGLVNEPGHFWTLSDYADYLPLANAGSTDHWTVMDFRPLRRYAAAGMLPGLNDELKLVIFGFDVGVLIGSGNRATAQLVRERGDGG
jgi:hypothetical protein